MVVSAGLVNTSGQHVANSHMKLTGNFSATDHLVGKLFQHPKGGQDFYPVLKMSLAVSF